MRTKKKKVSGKTFLTPLQDRFEAKMAGPTITEGARMPIATRFSSFIANSRATPSAVRPFSEPYNSPAPHAPQAQDPPPSAVRYYPRSLAMSRLQCTAVRSAGQLAAWSLGSPSSSSRSSQSMSLTSLVRRKKNLIDNESRPQRLCSPSDIVPFLTVHDDNFHPSETRHAESASRTFC